MAESSSTLNVEAKPYSPISQTKPLFPLIPSPPFYITHRPNVFRPAVYVYRQQLPFYPGLVSVANEEEMKVCSETVCKGKKLRRRQPQPRPVPCKLAWVRKPSNYVDLRGKSTVMMKNIPTKLERKDLLKLLDDHCQRENKMVFQENGSDQDLSAYDFVYLPVDFKTRGNKGYAFVNFTSEMAAIRAARVFHLMKWATLSLRREIDQSKKICEFSVAKIQGKEKLIQHFRKSVFECDSDEYLPVSFSRPRGVSSPPPSPRLVGRRSG